MADLNYKVTVDTTQAQQSINALKVTIGGLAAAFSGRAIVQFGDSITNLQNKLRTLSPNVSDVNKQFAAIAQIANDSRTSLTAVGDLYFRIARASESLGISQREAATITDTLAKGLASSGLSAQEAQGPLLQLGQALQAGRFQGDELRSILEGMPIVAKALADEMGVPIGRLKDLGSQGKITGDVFVRAMRNSRDSIVDAFGRTLPTVSQSLERLQTNLATLFVNVGGQEAMAALASAVGRLADAMAPLGKFIKENSDGLATLAKMTLGMVAAYVALTKGVKAVQAAQTALTAVFGLAGSSGSVWTGIIKGAERAAINFRKALGLISIEGLKLNRLGYVFAALGASLRVLLRFAGLVGIFYALAEAVDFLLRKLGANFQILGTLGKAWDWLKEKVFGAEEAQTDVANSTQNAVGALNDQVTATKAVVQATAEQIYAVEALKEAYNRTAQQQEDTLRLSNSLIGAGEQQRNMAENLRTSYENYLNQRRTLEKEILDATLKGTDEELAKLPLLTRALEELEARYKVNVQTIRDLTNEQERLTQARNLDVFGIESQRKSADDLIKIQRDIADLGLSEIEKKYKDIQYASEDAARAAIRAEETRRGGIKLSQAEIDAYYERARQGNEELRKQTGELFERSRSFSSGWQRAFREYADNATNAARRAEDLFRKATKGMEDAIVNFAKTGKFEWRNFVQMMAEELLRAQIQQLFAQIFNSARPPAMMGGGGGGGGAIGAIGGILGGIFSGDKQAPAPGGGGGGGFLDTIKSVGGGILDFGKSVIGGVGDFFGDIFRANGGPVIGGKSYIVGERGPELFTPTGSGMVSPNGSFGGATQVTYNINAVDAASFKQLVASDPSFIFAVTEQGRKSLPGGRR